MGEDRWREIRAAQAEGASIRETVIAVIDALIDPTLYHAGVEEPGSQRETDSGQVQTASDCRYSTWLIAEALESLGIEVDPEQRSFNHEAPWFPQIERGLWDGDDLYHPYHPRQMDRVASAEDLLDVVLVEVAVVDVLPHVRRGLLAATDGRTVARRIELDAALTLTKIVNWMRARDRFPEHEPVLERLPDGRLPSDPDGALQLAARVIEDEVLMAAACEEFFQTNIHPSYRDAEEPR